MVVQYIQIMLIVQLPLIVMYFKIMKSLAMEVLFILLNLEEVFLLLSILIKLLVQVASIKETQLC